MSEPDAFGYRTDPEIVEVYSVQVAEAKHAATLMPYVVLYVRTEENGPRAAYGISIELAEGLAAELARWVTRAREKHWE